MKAEGGPAGGADQLQPARKEGRRGIQNRQCAVAFLLSRSDHTRIHNRPSSLSFSLSPPPPNQAVFFFVGLASQVKGDIRAEEETREASTMSGGEDVRKVSRQDIQLVQNLIECCLQLYMNQKEVVETLSFQAKIEPSFTELVWQKLEEENREFFKAYYVRLMLKNQIMVFNKLLEDQYRLMSKEYPASAPSMPPTAPNGCNSGTLNQNACLLPDTTHSNAMPDSLLRNGSSGDIVNGAPSSDQFIYGGKAVHGLPGGMDASASLLAAHNSTAGHFNGDNGTTIKTESSYSSNSDFAFCNENAFLEPCQSMGDASGGSFSSSELNGQPLSDPILDMDLSSYGFLSQIPRNVSFSDLTEDFCQSAEILENYGRSPFIPSEANNFSESTAGEHTEIGNRRLDTISEGVSYEDVGSD